MDDCSRNPPGLTNISGMTNWVVVLLGFVIIAFGLALIRWATAFSDLQQRQMKAMRYPGAMRRRMTPGLARLGGAGFVGMGIVWIVVGSFFAEWL